MLSINDRKFTSLFFEYFKKDVCIISQNVTFISKYKTVIYRVYKKYRDGEYLEN